MKICSKCSQSKDESNFNARKASKDGLKSRCKICIAEDNKIINDKIANSEKSHITGKFCIHCNEVKSIEFFHKSKYSKDGYRTYCKAWCQKNERSENRKATRRKFRGGHKTQRNEYDKKLRNNPFNKLKIHITKTIWAILRKNKGGKSISKYLPYTISELKQHLERLFEPWMSWDNWGQYNANKQTWHIDHIIPQSALKYTSMDEENFQKCWALENLRPLSAIENMRKGDKY